MALPKFEIRNNGDAETLWTIPFGKLLNTVQQQIPTSAPGQSDSDRAFFTGALFEVGLGLLAVIVGTWIGVDPRETLPKIDQVGDLLWQVVLGIVWAIPIILFGVLLDRIPWKFLQSTRETTSQRLLDFFARFHVGQWLTLCLAAGVGEELLFRGLIQSGIANSSWLSGTAGWQPWIAIVLASVLFGLCHYLNLAYLVLATIFGVYFGFCFYWTGQILPAIVAHGVYDACLVAWMLYQHRREST